MSENLLTADELAERLAVSPSTVIEWAKAGRIPEIRPSQRIRRFDYEDVIASLKRTSWAEGTESRASGRRQGNE